MSGLGSDAEELMCVDLSSTSASHLYRPCRAALAERGVDTTVKPGLRRIIQGPQGAQRFVSSSSNQMSLPVNKSHIEELKPNRKR